LTSPIVQNPQRTTVRGPTFIRLLARLANVDAPQSNPSLPDRLSQWLSWAHAIALSTALDSGPSAMNADAPTFDSAVEEECARVHGSLVQAIAGDREVGLAGAAVDYKVFRQRYLTRQRAMMAATGNLRGRLRDMLAQTSVDMARLADVDAVMELALSPREQQLLATVPALLGEHFERLRQAEQTLDTATPGAWLDVFRNDMQSVLLAELDVRFQPVEGLLAALRTS
jgi:hypothetical protein